jgi:hypothetical protein
MAVNETGSAKKAVITVSLSGDGHTGSEQKFDFELRPGEKILRPMIFTAPDTATKKHFRLNAVMVCGETPSEQSFDLTIFPKSIPKTLRDKKIAVWDTDGSAAGLLKSIGAESVSLSDIDSLSGICLVVVGRNALNMQFARTAAKLGVPAWVRAGGRVIILEQAGEQEIGLRLDMRRAREVFKALPSHRVFAGLDDADLANWRGKSSLLEEFPTAAPGFHWSEPLVTSTLGVVSSFPAEKPHRGPFIPLMESGWDLQFSPLLEVRDGKGFIWICQLDLSRSERDPAADLLARNLLENALDAKAAEGAWLFTGDDRAETLLKKTGFSAQRLKQSNELSGAAGLILGPGGSAELSPREIEDFVRAGGVVICLPFGGTEKYLPLDISQTQVSADRAPASLADAEKRTVPASVSDLVWHDKFNLIGWDVKTGDGNFNRLMDQIPMGKGKIIYCGVDPEKFKGHYFMMKAFRLWSVLFCSLGVPAAAGAADRLLSCGSDTVIPLGGSALFKLDPKNDGLGQKWMDPGLKTDGGWDKIVVPGAWEKTPFLKSFGPVNPPPAAPDYNGVAWYRFDIDIPKDLKGTEAVLNMGVIDDYDTTFFNGVKIGGLGKEFGIHVYTAERAFSVPGELINWGGRNNITVRVEDNAGDGGIVSGKPRLEFLSGSSDGTDLYIKAQGIHEVFGVTPYYNEQW